MLYNFVFLYGDHDLYISLNKKHVHFYKKPKGDFEKKTGMLLRFPNLVSLYKYIQISVHVV